MEELTRNSENNAGEPTPEEPSSRPSLAERLMRAEPVAAAPGAAATAATIRDTRPAHAPAPPRQGEKRFAWNPGATRVSSPVVDNMLAEARRFIRFRYFVFMASVLVLFALTLVAGIVFVTSLLGDGDWEQTAISGALAGAALLILIALQYRPARSFSAAAFQVAQLEAARAHLNMSYDLWERYLGDKEDANQLTANDVATAVSSLNGASRLVDVEEMARLAEERRTGRATPPRGFNLPSSTTPDPRRF